MKGTGMGNRRYSAAVPPLPTPSPAPPPAKSRKGTIFFILKLVLAGGLIAWLVLSGQLDFSKLDVFWREPSLLVLNLGLFFLGACIGSWRYQALLRIANVQVKFRTLFTLQMTAFFFNVVIPGNIGGDVVKALYVARDQAAEKRTTILVLTFVERLLGVVALILVGALVMIVRPSVWSDPILRPMGGTVVALAAALIVGGIAALALVRVLGARLDNYTTGPSRISKLLNQLVASLRLVSEGPRSIAFALGLSMIYHASGIFLFTLILRSVLGSDTPYSTVATVFPIGLLSLMLPISPAGMGVGHVAFKKLFEAIGITGGATAFNVYIIAVNAPSLFGVFPFLTLKKRGELPPEASS
jgi:uncharacterized protein (TIRG00374 family)